MIEFFGYRSRLLRKAEIAILPTPKRDLAFELPGAIAPTNHADRVAALLIQLRQRIGQRSLVHARMKWPKLGEFRILPTTLGHRLKTRR